MTAVFIVSVFHRQGTAEILSSALFARYLRARSGPSPAAFLPCTTIVCLRIPHEKVFLSSVLIVSICLAQSAPSAKQKVLWQKLESKIEQVDRNLDGVMGIAIEDLTTGDHYFLREDEVFAQASSIKITVLANLYLQAQQGKLKLTDLYTVQSSDLVPDSDIMNGAYARRDACHAARSRHHDGRRQR